MIQVPFFRRRRTDGEASENGTSSTGTGASAASGLSIEMPSPSLVDANLGDIETQKRIVDEVEKILDKLPPDARQAVEGDLRAAESSLRMGSRASSSTILRLAQTLNNQEVKNLLKATFGGAGILCAGVAATSVSPGDLCTRGVSHGLDAACGPLRRNIGMAALMPA